jgi:hypothetical protein
MLWPIGQSSFAERVESDAAIQKNVLWIWEKQWLLVSASFSLFIEIDGQFLIEYLSTAFNQKFNQHLQNKYRVQQGIPKECRSSNSTAIVSGLGSIWSLFYLIEMYSFCHCCRHCSTCRASKPPIDNDINISSQGLLQVILILCGWLSSFLLLLDQAFFIVLNRWEIARPLSSALILLKASQSRSLFPFSCYAIVFSADPSAVLSIPSRCDIDISVVSVQWLVMLFCLSMISRSSTE